jgi:nucleoside-diphosphate-sugar epimerase
LADAYVLSKTLAEKAAWDYHSKMAPEEAFELVCVNPGLVMGPSFVGKGFTSGEIMDLFMMGVLPGQPRVMMTLVDVREVALAHLQAIKVPEARNHRFILVNTSLWFSEIAHALHAEFATQGYTINVGEMGYCTVSCISCFNSQAAAMKNLWDVELRCDNTASKEILKIEYEPNFGKVLVDMAYSMIETGAI